MIPYDELIFFRCLNHQSALDSLGHQHIPIRSIFPLITMNSPFWWVVKQELLETSFFHSAKPPGVQRGVTWLPRRRIWADHLSPLSETWLVSKQQWFFIPNLRWFGLFFQYGGNMGNLILFSFMEPLKQIQVIMISKYFLGWKLKDYINTNKNPQAFKYIWVVLPFSSGSPIWLHLIQVARDTPFYGHILGLTLDGKWFFLSR